MELFMVSIPYYCRNFVTNEANFNVIKPAVNQHTYRYILSNFTEFIPTFPTQSGERQMAGSRAVAPSLARSPLLVLLKHRAFMIDDFVNVRKLFMTSIVAQIDRQNVRRIMMLIIQELQRKIYKYRQCSLIDKMVIVMCKKNKKQFIIYSLVLQLCGCNHIVIYTYIQQYCKIL